MRLRQKTNKNHVKRSSQQYESVSRMLFDAMSVWFRGSPEKERNFMISCTLYRIWYTSEVLATLNSEH